MVRLHDPRNFAELRLGRQILTVGALRPVHVDGADVRAPRPDGNERGGVRRRAGRAAVRVQGVRLGRQAAASRRASARTRASASRTCSSARTAQLSYEDGRARLRVGARALVRPRRARQPTRSSTQGSPRRERPSRGASATSAPRSTRRTGRPRASSPRRRSSRRSATPPRTSSGRRSSGACSRASTCSRCSPCATPPASAGLDGTLRATLRLDDRGEGAISVEGRRQGSGPDQWTGAPRHRRGSRSSTRVRCSTELELVAPDDPRGRGSLWPWGLVALRWVPVRSLGVAGAVEAASTPTATREVNALARLGWTLGGAMKKAAPPAAPAPRAAARGLRRRSSGSARRRRSPSRTTSTRPRRASAASSATPGSFRRPTPTAPSPDDGDVRELPHRSRTTRATAADATGSTYVRSEAQADLDHLQVHARHALAAPEGQLRVLPPRRRDRLGPRPADDGALPVVPRAPGRLRRGAHVRSLPQGPSRRGGAPREPRRARRRLDARARQPGVLRARALLDVPRGQVLRRLPRAHDPRAPREARVRRHDARGRAPRGVRLAPLARGHARSRASARRATRRASSARAATRRTASTSRRAGRARTRPGGSACAESRTTTGRRRGADPSVCAACHTGAGESLCIGCHRVGAMGGSPHRPGWTSKMRPTIDQPCRSCHEVTP